MAGSDAGVARGVVADHPDVELTVAVSAVLVGYDCGDAMEAAFFGGERAALPRFGAIGAQVAGRRIERFLYELVVSPAGLDAGAGHAHGTARDRLAFEV